ncbi:MAG: hypothetical protein U9O20_01335 [Patescibacteria group bacterium]|nr:hypothetical protein [Patescibacteria group bacterium]
MDLNIKWYTVANTEVKHSGVDGSHKARVSQCQAQCKQAEPTCLAKAKAKASAGGSLKARVGCRQDKVIPSRGVFLI